MQQITATAASQTSYIGFTGTPLFKDNELTRQVFGEYVSTYDFQRAVEDEATVPLYFDKITCVRMHRLIEFYWNEYANCAMVFILIRQFLWLSNLRGYILHRSIHCAPRKEGV